MGVPETSGVVAIYDEIESRIPNPFNHFCKGGFDKIIQISILLFSRQDNSKTYTTGIQLWYFYLYLHNYFECTFDTIDNFNTNVTVYLKNKENISFLLFLAEISINQIKSDTNGIMSVFQSRLNKLAFFVAEIPHFS